MQNSQILKSLLTVVMMLVLASSCVKDELDGLLPDQIDELPDTPGGNGDILPMEELVVPSGFDFSTEKTVAIDISDTGTNVRYTILVRELTLKSGFIVDGILLAEVKVPSAATELTIHRAAPLGESEFTIPIEDGLLNFEYSEDD